jgi:chromodomain-helicase-DNA-binding protein 4
MVLDHLVVQQMGKENEEGDIDNMLLHGAAALYDTNAEGVSASDIRYTSKDVDALIEKVEADAIAESKAMEERDKAREANGDAPTGTEAGPSKPKETMSFAFAKIWEADSKRIHEMSDDEDEDDRADEDAEAWATAVENLRKQREAANADNGQRLRQRQAAVAPKFYAMPQDGAMSDDQAYPTPKKGKNGFKGKGKAREQSDQSDGDFAWVPGEESESDDDISALVADALDVFDIVDGKAVLKERKMPVNAEQAKATAKAKDVLQTAINDGTVVSSADAAELQNKAKREARKQEERRQQQREILSRIHLERSALGQVPGPTPARPPASAQIYDSFAKDGKAMRSAPVPPAVQAAQHIVQWLYHVLSNLALKPELKMWARMALPEIPGDERGKLYMALAEKADDEMYRRGQRMYFQLPETIDKVLPLLVVGGSVVPGADDIPNTMMPLVPDVLGDLRPEAQAYRRQMHVEAPPSAQGSRQYTQHLPSPYHSPQFGHNQKLIAAPAQPPPTLPIAAPAATSVQPTRSDARAHAGSAPPGPSARPRSVIPPANNRATGTVNATVPLTHDGVQAACPFCHKAHYLSDCKEIPSVEWLKLERTKIINNSESELTKVGDV